MGALPPFSAGAWRGGRVPPQMSLVLHPRDVYLDAIECRAGEVKKELKGNQRISFFFLSFFRFVFWAAVLPKTQKNAT